MKRKLILLSLASLGLTATAQTAAEAGYVGKVITECQRLHSDGEYRSALILIEKIDARNLDERTRQEYELQRALTTFENDHRKGKALMMKYIADYPNTSQEVSISTLPIWKTSLTIQHQTAPLILRLCKLQAVRRLPQAKVPISM